MTASSTLLDLLIVCPSERTSSRRKWSRFPQSRGTCQKVTFCQPSPAVDTISSGHGLRFQVRA